MLAQGLPGGNRPKSAAAYALHGAIQHELQSVLQMVASCAGLGGACKETSCTPRLAAASVELGMLSQRFRAWGVQMLLVLGFGPLRNFRKVPSMDQFRLFIWKQHWNWFGGPRSLLGHSLKEHQGRVNWF